VCLLRNGIELVVAHCGDSRALLCRNGDVVRLTTDHNSNVKAEKERIVKSNGFLKSDSLGVGLVNGRLAMTRSIGDLDLKPYGVIALPDTRSLEVSIGCHS
jgi:protein phosphatase 1K